MNNNIENKGLNTHPSSPMTKILVAGVGGQGVVFLTNLLVKAAMLADIPVATSEIHGLAQRGGSVTAGITLGENTFGFLEKGGVDLLFGLEPLETQRCTSYLHKGSVAIIDDFRILPYSVNSGHQQYPDVESFIHFLEENIHQVIYNTSCPAELKSVQRNLFLLGRATAELDFPIASEFIDDAIREVVKEGLEEKCLLAFKQGADQKEINVN